MKTSPSPNFDDRSLSEPLSYIVLHYTGMQSEQAALERMMDPAAKVSAHYMISEDGAVTALVNETKRAWHAGKSFWKGATDINSTSIGIELVNPGHEFGYKPFPNQQIEALEILLADIIVRNNMSGKEALLAHSDIAPTRKQDPGELFPWQRLAEKGFGKWPDPSAITQDRTAMNEGQLLAELSKIGYDTTNSAAAFTAFHRRYRPHNPTETPDKETAKLLLWLSNSVL